MNKVICPLLMATLLTPLKSGFVVRPAELEDIPEIIHIDTRVALEYFKPIYQEHYAEYPFGKCADESLKREVEADRQAFTQCITAQNDEKLYIATDSEKNALAAFIFFHKDADAVEVDLMCVDKPYRRLGVGKKLLARAIGTFADIKQCFLYTLLAGNAGTHQFYEKLGFTGSPGSADRKNFYDIPHSDVYRYYTLDLAFSSMVEDRED
jgi:GNAT superfamily N-acetyltransferase